MPWASQLNSTRTVDPRKLLCIVVFLLVAGLLRADPPRPAPTAKHSTMPAPEWTPETVQSHIKQLEDAKEIKDDEKKKIVEIYKQALLQFKTASEWTAQSTALTRRCKETPTLVKELRKRLKAAPAGTEKPVVRSDDSSTAVEAELVQVKNEWVDLNKRAEDAEAEPKRRAERRKLLPDLRQAVRKNLEDLHHNPPGARIGESAEMLAARLALYAAQERALQTEADCYVQELISFDAASELLALERDSFVRDLVQVRKRAETLTEELNRRRREEAETATRKAEQMQRERATAHPILAKLAKDNQGLAEQRTGAKSLVGRIEESQKTVTLVRAEWTALRKQRAQTLEWIEKTGLNPHTGQILRRQQTELFGLLRRQTALRRRQNDMAETQSRLLDLENERSALADVEPRVRESVQQSRLTGKDRETFESTARELWNTRRELLDALILDHSSYMAKLADLDSVERELTALAHDYSSYISTNVMWLKSASLLDGEEVLQLGGVLRAAASPEAWSGVAAVLVADARSNTRTALAFGVALIGWILFHRWMRLRLRRLGEDVAADYLNTFSSTVWASILTLLIAAFEPVMVGYVGWRLISAYDAPPFAEAVGWGLIHLAAVYATVAFLRQICRRYGLGESHFRWRFAALRASRRFLNLLLPVAATAAFLVGMAEAQSNDVWKASLGRIAFVGGMLALSWFLAQILRPTGKVMKDALANRQDSRLYQTRYIWYPLLAGTPALLAAVAVEGHYFTALQLSQRLLPSLWLCMGLIVANALAVRWLFTARGRLALQRAKERREAAAEAAEANTDVLVLDQGQMDLSTVNEHTRKLVRCGVLVAVAASFWLLWADTLPAFAFLTEREIWTTEVQHSESSKGPEGKPVITTRSDLIKITPMHLAMAAAIVWLTLVVAGNLPGLLEVILSLKLARDAGARYAVCTMVRYAITLVGVCSAGRVLGVGWIHVQWLAAAMTVGLGFGLQEIFANFVSGLILLFERPIRLGDTVSVGDVTGTVTRLRIRATTITDANRRELVVPNKEFITGKIVNWTLSDRVARIQVKVGIAYGSDPDQAMKIMLEVAGRHPDVLQEPAPSAMFDAFGESTQDMILNAYVANLDNVARVRHELNTSIARVFNESGVECAYPHRDVTVRAVTPAAVKFVESLRDSA